VRGALIAALPLFAGAAEAQPLLACEIDELCEIATGSAECAPPDPAFDRLHLFFAPDGESASVILGDIAREFQATAGSNTFHLVDNHTLQALALGADGTTMFLAQMHPAVGIAMVIRATCEDAT